MMTVMESSVSVSTSIIVDGWRVVKWFLEIQVNIFGGNFIQGFRVPWKARKLRMMPR